MDQNTVLKNTKDHRFKLTKIFYFQNKIKFSIEKTIMIKLILTFMKKYCIKSMSNNINHKITLI